MRPGGEASEAQGGDAVDQGDGADEGLAVVEEDVADQGRLPGEVAVTLAVRVADDSEAETVSATLEVARTTRTATGADEVAAARSRRRSRRRG